MRAVVLDAVPAPPDALVGLELPVPQPQPGWVLIDVKAFGLKRSVMKTPLWPAPARLGLDRGQVLRPEPLGAEDAARPGRRRRHAAARAGNRGDRRRRGLP